MTKPILLVDLFSGAGGFSLAAKNLGFHIAGALEFNPWACKTYHENISQLQNPPPILVKQDILKITPRKFASLLNIKPGEIDILAGGPPCQGFSSHRLDESAVDDPRNKLLFRYFDFIKYLRPKAFIVENVPGMLWKRHKFYLENFYELSNSLGYITCPPTVLNAKDFGVPQNRRRVFVLGLNNNTKQNVNWPPEPTHVSDSSKEYLEGRKPTWKTADLVFSKPISPTDPNNIHMTHRPELVEVFKSTPPNGGSRSESNRILPCHRKHKGHRDVYGRIDPNKAGPTMTTACTNPSKGRFLHPTEHHGITVRHAARFQTFPDDFIFMGGIIETSRQVGNAVPIRLGEAVLSQVAQILTSNS